MKRFVIALAVIALAGCGVETTTAVATGAAIKKRELEEGQKTQERMKQKIDQVMEQAQQRAQQSDDSNAR
jgi:hypothetical protein